MGRNGRKRGWCGGRRRDWKLRWQNRNIRVVRVMMGRLRVMMRRSKVI